MVLAGCSDTSSPANQASQVASGGVFYATDCAQNADPAEVDSASGTAITPDVTVLDGDVPTVYVRENAAPVSELVVTELAPGTGQAASLDDFITVNYCGVGLTSGAVFDSSWARGAPAPFPLSQGQLIQGWIDGIPGMQVGERRVLTIPSDLAYGDNPPPGIAPGETLVFVVELLDIAQ